MNMILNNQSAEDEFSDLFNLETKDEKIKHQASMFMFRCLSEIERTTENKLSKKQLSKMVETSPSYITQLFRGDKLINLIMLAKFEIALDSEFEIILRKNSEKKNEVSISTTTSYLPIQTSTDIYVHVNIDSTSPKSGTPITYNNTFSRLEEIYA